MLEVFEYPPIPVSLASVRGTDVDCWNIMLLIDIPFCARLSMLIHIKRSFFVSSFIFARAFFVCVVFSSTQAVHEVTGGGDDETCVLKAIDECC